jgi:hypothetical protein
MARSSEVLKKLFGIFGKRIMGKLKQPNGVQSEIS